MRRHRFMWLDGEGARLGYERPGCKCEAQAKRSGSMGHQGREAGVDSLASMNQGNSEV
jgi:hypothetical protein